MSQIFEKLLILRTPGIGPVKYNVLVNRFGSVAAAAASLNSDVAHRDAVLREMDLAQTMGIQYISDDMPNYPVRLKELKNHPPVISARGDVGALNKPIVSMVGTRHATATGMGFMANMANEFANRNFAVASGLAIGTDTAAHKGALRAAQSAVTIAVVAGGVDYIWPMENESLYYEILERGVVVSEMPVGFVPVATNFIQRNRWVAGMCDALILGEADSKSGSMATARFAIEYGRDLWAIPSHPSDARAAGPNSMISTGAAKLCSGIADFFADAQKNENKKKITTKNESENSLIDKISSNPVSESVLAEVVKKSVSEIKSELVVLELQGLVRKVDGGYVLV